MTEIEKTVAGKTIREWQEHARRDDCLDRMVPSDLRGILIALEAEIAAVERLWEIMPYMRQIQYKFPVGARVEMSDRGVSQFPRYEGKTGAVMRHANGGWSPSIKWDHRKTEHSYAHEFLRVVDEEQP